MGGGLEVLQMRIAQAVLQHICLYFHKKMSQNGSNLFTKAGLRLLAVDNGMRTGSFCSPD